MVLGGAPLDAQASAALHYPQTPRSSLTEDVGGQRIADPYRWLENTASTEVRNWVTAQNALTESFLAQTPARRRVQDLIVRAKTKNEIWWSISGRPVHNDLGHFFGFRGFASDLTRMRQSEVELDRLARQDSLTGLANREALRRALDDALVGAHPAAEDVFRPVPVPVVFALFEDVERQLHRFCTGSWAC